MITTPQLRKFLLWFSAVSWFTALRWGITEQIQPQHEKLPVLWGIWLHGSFALGMAALCGLPRE